MKQLPLHGLSGPSPSQTQCSSEPFMFSQDLAVGRTNETARMRAYHRTLTGRSWNGLCFIFRILDTEDFPVP
jgi:hypothetical protein